MVAELQMKGSEVWIMLKNQGSKIMKQVGAIMNSLEKAEDNIITEVSWSKKPQTMSATLCNKFNFGVYFSCFKRTNCTESLCKCLSHSWE